MIFYPAMIAESGPETGWTEDDISGGFIASIWDGKTLDNLIRDSIDVRSACYPDRTIGMGQMADRAL
jgi:hypothetical protein